MILKCDAEGKEILDHMVKLSMKAGLFGDPKSLNAFIASIETIEPEEVEQKLKAVKKD